MEMPQVIWKDGKWSVLYPKAPVGLPFCGKCGKRRALSFRKVEDTWVNFCSECAPA